MINTTRIIQKYYTEDTELYNILMLHSQHVKQKVLDVCDKHPELQVDRQFMEEACMLHDIGIFLCDAPSIQCFGSHQYVEHGYLGADLIRAEDLPRHALVCERHTGVGISLQSVIERNLPLPHRDFVPVTVEEQMICYADKFFSKSKLDSPHSIEHILQQLARHSSEYPEIFMHWHSKFG